jgi:hypothetical protein
MMQPCVGCGGLFEPVDGPTHRYMTSSPACWAAYGEVLARQYSDPNRAAYYRFSVDAYAVQHPGAPCRQSIQSVGVHLIRLCFLVDQQLDMARANDAIIAASANKHRFWWLQPPLRFEHTIADVAKAQDTQQLEQAVNTWARQAWASWSAHHATIRSWLPMQFAQQ